MDELLFWSATSIWLFGNITLYIVVLARNNNRNISLFDQWKIRQKAILKFNLLFLLACLATIKSMGIYPSGLAIILVWGILYPGIRLLFPQGHYNEWQTPHSN